MKNIESVKNMAENKVDYHIHSNYSDGTLSPAELVQRYRSEGYDSIAITDHDGVSGVGEALAEAERLGGIQVIPGIELSTEYNGIDVHLLGYNLDYKDEALNAKLDEILMWRRERNRKLVDIMVKNGYPIDLQELEKESKGAYVGEPNIARMLVKMGFAESVAQVFEDEKALKNPEVKGVKKKKLSLYEALELLKSCGGTPVLAHPGKLKRMGEIGSDEYWERLEEMIGDLKAHGLKGLECYHPSQSPEMSLRLVELAEKYRLHITAGSDFHGDK